MAGGFPEQQEGHTGLEEVLGGGGVHHPTSVAVRPTWAHGRGLWPGGLQAGLAGPRFEVRCLRREEVAGTQEVYRPGGGFELSASHASLIIAGARLARCLRTWWKLTRLRRSVRFPGVLQSWLELSGALLPWVPGPGVAAHSPVRVSPP